MPLDHARPDSAVGLTAPDGAVEAEQTRLLLRNPIDVPANLINAGLVGVIVWPLFQAWVLTLWLGLVCIVSLARALLRHRYASASGAANPTFA